MRLFSVGVFVVLSLAGCAPKPARRPRSAPPPPPSTAHNWLYRDGQDYAYQPAPAAQMYRYLGEHGGLYKLRVGGDVATCANPCQVITLSTGPFHVERLAFDPDSIIGAAFTDAFNGQLDVYDPARRAR